MLDNQVSTAIIPVLAPVGYSEGYDLESRSVGDAIAHSN